MVTEEQIHALTPRAEPGITLAIARLSADVMPRWGINSTLRLQMLMTTMCVESAYFTRTEENLDYSADRLCKVWPKRFPTRAEAQLYAHNPRKLANKVYGGRMGNTGPDDGWTYRGQGLIQSTGFNNFRDLSRVLNCSVPEVIERAQDPAFMLEVACAHFMLLKGPEAADTGKLETVILAIRGACSDEDMTARGSVLAKARKIFNHL